MLDTARRNDEEHQQIGFNSHKVASQRTVAVIAWKSWIITEQSGPGIKGSHMTIKRPIEGWAIQGVTTHPGVILREDFLRPMEISANHLAMKTRMPATRVGEILHGRRGISTDTALRFGHYFGTSAEFWINLQANYDLSKARSERNDTIQREVEPLKLEAIGAYHS